MLLLGKYVFIRSEEIVNNNEYIANGDKESTYISFNMVSWVLWDDYT